MTQRPTLSIVIPTFNRASLLERCLDRLAPQAPPDAGVEVVVADDGSTDDTPGVVARWARSGLLDVHHVLCPRGYQGAARNRGARAASGDRILFLGDDIMAEPDLLRCHADAAARWGPEVVVLGEVVFPEDDRAAYPFMRYLEDEGVHHDFPRIRAAGAAPLPGRYFYACNASLSRSALAAVGGFDERIGPALEDTELGARLVRHGYELRFEPSARGVHLHRHRLDEYLRSRRLHRHHAALALALMRDAGEAVPTVEPHPILDALASDNAVALAARAVSALEEALPSRVRTAAYRRFIRLEQRRTLQAAAAVTA